MNSNPLFESANTKTLKKPQRLWELDVLRGIAIVMMVVYHGVFYLDWFFDQPVQSQVGFWYWEGRFSAILFMLLVGVASVIIRQRYQGVAYFNKQFKRGIRLIFLGMVVTLVTWFIVQEQTIWFGILSFIGFGILLTIPVAHRPWLSLILAVLSLALGLWINTLEWNSFLGVFLGAPPANYQSLDYYPLLPRLGWVLLGIFLGHQVYPRAEPLFQIAPGPMAKGLAWMGKKSLWIYLIHPLVLFGLMWLIFNVT